MKHLILIDIELSNWKAQNVKVDFSDKSTTITGWCGSGKTAIYKAWCWLITGYCDAINPKNHELFDNGAEITPDTPTASVTATISIDGTEYKLQRTAKAGFNKGVKSSSDTYKYFIDGIATKANDFDKFIADTIAPCKLPLYMTMGEAFANLAETDKDSARMILEDAAGEITASDMQGDYALIADDIIKFGYDKLEMRYRTEMRDLNNDIKAKDIAIGFKEENVARLKQTDFASIESEIGRNNERIAAIDAELLNDAEAIKAKIEERNKKIQELQGLKMRLNTAEMDFNAEHSKKIREVEMHIEDMKISEKARARRNAALKEAYERELANIKAMKESVAQFEKEREILLTKRDEIFNRELADTNCPVCGKPLEGDKLDELQESFNRKKREELDLIVMRGKKVRADIDALKEKITIKESTLTEPQYEPQQDIEPLYEELNGLRGTMPKFSATETYRELSAAIAAKSAEITDVAQEKDNTELCREKNNLMEQNSQLHQRLGLRIVLADEGKALEELLATKRELATKAVKCQQRIDKAKEYVEERASIISERINNRMNGFRIIMSERLKNGTDNPCCKIVDENGVKYSTMNFSARIRACLAIQTMLCTRYGVQMPIFIDEAAVFDSVTLPKYEGQTIYLFASDNDFSVKQ